MKDRFDKDFKNQPPNFESMCTVFRSGSTGKLPLICRLFAHHVTWKEPGTQAEDITLSVSLKKGEKAQHPSTLSSHCTAGAEVLCVTPSVCWSHELIPFSLLGTVLPLKM